MLQYILFPDSVQIPQVLPLDYGLIALAMICLTAFLVAAVWPGQSPIHRYALPDTLVRPLFSPRVSQLREGYYYVDATGRIHAMSAPQQPQPPTGIDELWRNAGTGVPWQALSPIQQSKKKSRPKMSSNKRFRILRRDNFRCQLCGRSNDDGVVLHIDHKMPLAKGGSNGDDNLWTLCSDCNGGKSDDIIEEILEDTANAEEVE